jgi:CheY-like chemotaxis protein
MVKVREKCVLIVDDSSSLRIVLSLCLEKAGFEVIRAKDGIDALGKLRETLPKVIISDLRMPRMSGFEFIGVVRRRFPAIPVIAFSASIPSKLPPETNPNCWMEKKAAAFPDLVQSVNELARTAPDQVDYLHVVPTPFRVRPDISSHFVLTCTDCLRTFRATNTPGNKAVQGNAVCIHCQARVPYLIEGSTRDHGNGKGP